MKQYTITMLFPTMGSTTVICKAENIKKAIAQWDYTVKKLGTRIIEVKENLCEQKLKTDLDITKPSTI